MAQKVTIQGFEGSFHQIAARQFFGKQVEVIPCATFHEVVEQTRKKMADASVMAIENSIAGSILPNYHLLQKSGLKIAGEVYLPIRQHLLVNPGVTLSDIREVHSHPMALQQCLDFLVQHNWKLVETEDTALSAKRLQQHKSRHTAAVAGKLAADLFGLDILVENIHTQKQNYTRFLILQRESEVPEAANKASVSFHTDHSKGSLARVLTRIAEGGINLSKLQSFPIPGTEWKYQFHADMEFEHREQLDAVLKDVKAVTQETQVYGIYKNGRK
ncbi:MAG TPA: prephenate dehydratase [Flavisolibacter sp.]|jgi:prephenate dehydratase|nr:prephenate dehydratase [Flavisolibacter sp.]